MREAWILAGILDGVAGYPRLDDDVCGIPHVLRLACELALAGAEQIYVVWNTVAPPDLSAVAADPRLRAKLVIVDAPPAGDDGDAILVVRGDRLFHRDMPRLALAAYRSAAAPDTVGKLRGDEHDAVLATDRRTARRLAARALEPVGLARELRTLRIVEADLPYAGFTARASGPRSLRRAERQLVWSLRKAADGLAAKALNRRISLPISWRLSRTAIHPNHVTLCALLLAVAGASIIATGGYLAGVAGMLLVELGSIVDGIDGELARLRYQFSRTGQWLDTVVDDLANVAYVSAVTLSLDASGVTWAVPLGALALAAFALTQTTQYALVKYVYRSGDLAAIPWAFQSAEFLSQRPTLRSTLPKLLKRDFVVTLFVGFAIAGRLDGILLVFAGGAFAFFAVFFAQLWRNRASVTS